MQLSVTKTTKHHKKNLRLPLIMSFLGALWPIMLIVILYSNHPKIKGITSVLNSADIIAVTNEVRLSHGLSPLHPQNQLIQAAEAKAKAMIEANSWSHNTPTETPWQFIDSQGYPYTIAGENLAKGFNTAETVVNAWLNSPSHRSNLLSPDYTDIGVAVVTATYQNKEDTNLIVQFLAKRYDPLIDNIDNPETDQFPILSNPLQSKNMYYLLISFTGIIFLISFINLVRLTLFKTRKRVRVPGMFYWKH